MTVEYYKCNEFSRILEVRTYSMITDKNIKNLLNNKQPQHSITIYIYIYYIYSIVYFDNIIVVCYVMI